MGDFIHQKQAEMPLNNHILHNIPQPQHGRFVGREQEIEDIRRILLPYPKSQHYLVSIDGVGGIGKSALAIEIALAYYRNYFDIPPDERFDAIVWTSAKSSLLIDTLIRRNKILDTLTSICEEIVRVLDPDCDSADEDIIDLVLQLLTQKRTLLIIDNLETISDEAVYGFIREIPAPTRVIVTTRQRLNVAYPIRLEGMKWDDAKKLIEYECDKQGLVLSTNNKQLLFERTGGVPLALVWSIAQIRFREDIPVVLRKLGNPSGDIARFCFEKVVESIRGKPSHKLLVALSVFDNGAESDDLMYVADLPQLDAEAGLAELERLSLVNRVGDSKFFTMLTLTREYAQAELAQIPQLNDDIIYRRNRWKSRDLIQSEITDIEKWLTDNNIDLKSYRVRDSADVNFDRLAVFLGERYSSLTTLIQKMKQSLSTGTGFQMNLPQRKPEDISNITQFCLMLNEQGFALEYKYQKTTKKLTLALQQDPKLIEFINSGWFVRYIMLQALRLLAQNNIIEYRVATNIQFAVGDKNFGLDLFFLINNQPIMIKCRATPYRDEDPIKKFAALTTAMKLNANRVVLVILGISKRSAANLVKRHKLLITDELDFLTYFQSLIAEAASSPISTKNAMDIQSLIAPTAPGVYTILNRKQVRPFPEIRTTVIKALISIIDQLVEPKTMSEIKLILYERLNLNSKSQLQDVLNAIVRSGCLIDAEGNMVTQYVIPIEEIISYDPNIIETKCLEYYIKVILVGDSNFFKDPENLVEYERVVGVKPPEMSLVEQIKQELNLE